MGDRKQDNSLTWVSRRHSSSVTGKLGDDKFSQGEEALPLGWPEAEDVRPKSRRPRSRQFHNSYEGEQKAAMNPSPH